jgi:hypothetical protein
MKRMSNLWHRLKCGLNRHDYAPLGLDYKDKIYRCRVCGRRHVERYTLRIDRLGRLPPGEQGGERG